MIQKLSVRKKLFLLLMVPVLALLFFSILGIRERYAVLRETEALEPIVTLAVHVSNAIHETQKERGRCAVFISSGGNDGGAYHAQQAVADQKIDLLLSFMETFDTSARDPSVMGPILEGLTALKNLKAHRRAVDAGMPLSPAAGYYTKIHAMFLNGLAGFLDQLSHPVLLTQTAGYVNFMKAKECAGQERALLSVVFVADRFVSDQYARFIELGAGEAKYLEQFLAFVDADQRRVFLKKQENPVFEKVASYRQKARANSVDGFGVEATAWFAAKTTKINVYHESELALAAYLENTAKNLSEKASRNLLIFSVIVFGVLIFSGLLSLAVSRSIVKPLSLMSKTMARLSEEKDLSLRNHYVAEDEIGLLATKMDDFLQTIEEMVGQITEAGGMVNQASGDLALNATNLFTHSKHLTERTQEIVVAGEELSANINGISASMTQAAQNLSMVSAGAEEMSITINEISQGTNKAKQNSFSATNEIQVAHGNVANLNHAANEIKGIIDTINAIAEQTKLLALNATIEASRAGDMGRGFSVVAGEVKALARQVVEAAEDIRNKVNAMSDVSKVAAEQIGTVRQTVGEVDEIITIIAASIEEQSITTKSMAQNILQVDFGVKEAGENMVAVADVSTGMASDLVAVKQMVEEVRGNANEVQNYSQDLERTGNGLVDLVGAFKVSRLS